MPDDHSEVVPLLPIPNRTVKRLRADDSAGSRVKVGHCQALTAANAQSCDWAFSLPLRGSNHQVDAFEVKRKRKSFECSESCARIQGFADHSGPARKSSFLQIFKNIQPISVGV